jgi:hypothetical protein
VAGIGELGTTAAVTSNRSTLLFSRTLPKYLCLPPGVTCTPS